MAILIPARNVPSAATVTMVVDAFCNQYGYQTLINGQPNPQTKSQFALQQVDNFIINTVKADKIKTPVEAARTQAITDVDSQVVIT